MVSLLISLAGYGQSGSPKGSRNQSSSMSSSERQEKEELAREYYRNKEYSKAVSVLDNVYWKNPSHSNYIYYTYSLFGLQNFEKAEKVVKHQADQYPNQVRYKVDLGYVYRNLNKTKKADRLYNKILDNLSDNENLIKQTANAFMVRRENDYALKTYDKGNDLFDDPYKFALEKGQLYDRMGKYEKMFDEYLGLLASENNKMQRVQYRIQNSLQDDRDNEKANYFKKALLSKVQSNPDTRIYSELLLWLAIQQRDFDMALRHTKALERRFDLGGQKIYELGNVAMNNRRYNIATEAFAFGLEIIPESSPLHYRTLTEKLKAEFKALTHQKKPKEEELLKLEQAYHETLDEMGKNKLTYPLITNLARLNAYHLGNDEEATKLLREALEMGGIDKKNLAETKIELANVLLFHDDYWEATLLYSQVEKDFPNEPIGHEAKYQNAMLSYYIGEFDWAKAKFDVLRSATSKLIANDALDMAFLMQENLENDSIHKPMQMFARGSMLLYQNRNEEALQTFDSLAKNYPTNPLRDNILFKKA
ncbi:MAG: tetratricopeptide repeat protein, partial [Bacteroidota bacterium]